MREAALALRDAAFDADAIRIASRARAAKPSATKAMTQLARRLQEDGHKIVTLSQGEPDFPTPPHICGAARRAMDAGQTRYTEVAGTRALRLAIARKMARDHGIEAEIDAIQVASGAKQVIYNALQATVEAGDEVVIPTPAWVSYPEMVRLASGEPVLVPCAATTGFKLTPSALAAALTPRTRWLILNSPGNPTGAIYDVDALRALAGVLRSWPQVAILCDDIYEKIRYDSAPFATMAAVAPDLADRTLTVNGLSKAYAMTGWRVGYGVGPVALIRAMNTIQSQSSSHACSVAQAAAVAALDGPTDFLACRLEDFRRRRDRLVAGLNRFSIFRSDVPEGAFYLFPSCAAAIGRTSPSGRRLLDDEAVAMWLLEEARVAVVPGSAFGCAGHLRFSYAAADADIEAALEGIEAAALRLE